MQGLARPKCGHKVSSQNVFYHTFTLQFVNANLANRRSDEVECPGTPNMQLVSAAAIKIVCCHDKVNVWPHHIISWPRNNFLEAIVFYEMSPVRLHTSL